MRYASVAVIAAGLLGSGCATSRFVEAEAAERQIESAEDAGADAKGVPALGLAKRSIAYAREAESRATADLKEARAALEEARRRQTAAAVLEKRKAAELADIEAATKVGREQLEAAERREVQLREKGLAEDEVADAAGPASVLARLRLEGSTASKSTIEKEIQLARLERDDAIVHVRAASSRIDSAQQRLAVARSLYERAEHQAKVAEAEALEGERQKAGAKLGQM